MPIIPKQALIPLALIALLIAACQPQSAPDTLPTLAMLPSPTSTETATPTPTESPTPTPTPTLTLTPTNTETATPTPTNTRLPTFTPTLAPSATTNATQALIGTSTAAVLEAPRFATFTPIPPNVTAVVRPTSTGTPIILADVTITESQFQEEVDRLLADSSDIQEAQVDFVAGAVEIRLVALGGEAFTTGIVPIYFDLLGDPSGLNNLVRISPAAPDQFRMADEALLPSDAFIEIAYTDLFPAVGEAFNAILNQRLGQGRHNLEWMSITEDAMQLNLLVPQP